MGHATTTTSITFSVTLEEDTLRSENEDDVMGVGAVGLFRRSRADELVRFVHGFEHLSAVGIFVGMVLLGQPEVRL